MDQEAELHSLREKLRNIELLKEPFGKEEIVLVGHQYKGRFVAVQRQGRVETGSEYTSAYEYRFYWKGKGVIEHKKRQGKQRFLLNTWVLHDGREWAGGTTKHSLEDELVRFKNGWSRVRIEKGNITDYHYQAVLDLVLQKMYFDAFEKEDEDIVPDIHPAPLKVEELIEKKLISDSIGLVKVY